jgi:peptidoglycan hydrolase-like protein with peptidoglycan-binding domain
MPRTVCARGVHGACVATLQQGLSRNGLYSGVVDGLYGGGTERAVRAHQVIAKLPPTGVADEVTWTSATGLPIPPLASRCLQLTAAIEGHGYGMVAGNFDGAGLTWGIIGFTLKFGDLRDLILTVQNQYPEAITDAFGTLANELLDKIVLDFPKAQAWANSISEGPTRYAVRKDWRDGFARLGARPEVRRIQVERAVHRYYEPALVTAGRIGFSTELGVALAFDIHVQNGGVKAPALKQLLRERQDGALKSQRALRLRTAELVAQSANSTWRPDVLTRKTAIARAEGTVHGELLVLEHWGLGEYAV